MNKNPTLHSIQYLRAMAALFVAVAHINWTNPLWGQQGVDVFFVISGFIMMHVSRRENRPLVFLRARALRIVPLYWVTTFAWLALHPTNDVEHVVLSLGFIPHIGPQNTIWPVVWQGWTLLYEVFFYAAFAATLLLPTRFGLPLLTGIFGLLALVGWVIGSKTAFAEVYLSPLLLEFLAGCWLHRAWERHWLRPALGLAAVAVSAAAFIWLRDWDPAGWRLIAWGIPALLLVGGSLALEDKLPRIFPLLMLGDASYALYLTHRFVVTDLAVALHPLPMPIAMTGVLMGCAAIGVAVHFVIEKPISGVLKRRPLLLGWTGSTR